MLPMTIGTNQYLKREYNIVLTMNTIVKLKAISERLCLAHVKAGEDSLVVMHAYVLISEQKKTLKTQNLVNIYLFKVNIKNTRKRCKICSMFNVQNDVTDVILCFYC